MRAVIYARYSSDNQRDTSIDDQVAGCRRVAEREGLEVVDVHSDREISGATPAESRPGARTLLKEAATQSFDVLLIEGLDRLSRDIVDQEKVIRRLEHRGIRVVGIFDGYDSNREGRELQRAIHGAFNEEYLRALSKKTYRGLAGQFDRGLFAGGMAYGYTTVDVAGGRALVRDETEATWVRWIFEQYIAGQSPRAIAHELNRRRVPSPRGRTWAISAIYGSPAKGTGILNNELYIGRYTWNRSKWVKDPDPPRKRKRIERPRHEWKTVERPELRIVAPEAWDAVRARLARPAIHGGRGKGRPAATLLGGLLRCANCGGPVVAVNNLLYACAANKDRGPAVCPGVSVDRKTTELRILSTLRDELLAPESIAMLQQEVRTAMAELTQDETAARASTRARLEKLEREIRNLTDAIAAAGWSTSIAERLAAAERERTRLRAIVNAPTPRVAEIPNVLMNYKRLLANFPGTLKQDITAARTALRALLHEVRLVNEGEQVFAEINIPADRILLTVGGSVDMCGSGGSIPYIYTNRVRVR